MVDVKVKILSQKLRHGGAICWLRNNYIFLSYGLAYIFFWKKTFLFRQLKFSAFVWFRISWTLTKFQTTFVSIFSIGCLRFSQLTDLDGAIFEWRFWLTSYILWVKSEDSFSRFLLIIACLFLTITIKKGNLPDNTDLKTVPPHCVVDTVVTYVLLHLLRNSGCSFTMMQIVVINRIFKQK